MRAFIHGFRGRPWNTECRDAEEGFHRLGIKTILFTTNEEFDTRNREDVVVGGTEIIWHALSQNGVTAAHFDYPEELKAYLGRKIWKAKLNEIQEDILPVFVKPVEEKLAPGLVVNSMADLAEYEWLDRSTEMYFSEAVRFVSEWRCFLLYGRIIDIRFYYGNRDIQYDETVIQNAVNVFSEMPSGCAFDFGVTEDGRTLLVEMNDGYSLGSYGLDSALYARLLAARWAEMNGTEDVLKDIPILANT